MKKFVRFTALFMLGVMMTLGFASCGNKIGEGAENEKITENEPDSEGEDNVVETYNYDFDTEVLFLGRTYKSEDACWFNWTNSGFEIKFKGSGAEAVLVSDVKDDQHKAYVKVYVDGVPYKKISLESASQRVVLAENLDSTQEHTLRAVMISGNNKSATAGVSEIVLTDGEKLAPSVLDSNVLKMEIIGDSISIGYGILGGADDELWTTQTEDGTLTYAALAARAFGMEYNVIGASGRGVYMNIGGTTEGTIPSVYTQVDGYRGNENEWNFDNFAPDVIVINLGTNDSSNSTTLLKSEDLKAAIKEFLTTVRQKNPDAVIIWAYGAMTSSRSPIIQSVIKEFNDAGDKNMHFLSLTKITSEQTGTHGHPNLAGAQAHAEVLIDKIRELTGYEVKYTVDNIVENEKKLFD